MYGYQVLLQCPDRTRQTVLRVVSANRYASVISLLQGESLWKQYGQWDLLSFETAFAPTPSARPVLVDKQVAPPGTALSVVV